MLSVVILSLCSIINIVFLVLRQRNARHHKDKTIKVKSRSKKKTHKRNVNTRSTDEESIRERLLEDSEESDVENGTQRASSASKLLGNKNSNDGDRYRSLSCSNCTENCAIIVDNHSSGK